MIQQLFVLKVDSESVRMFSDDLRKRGRAVPGPGFSHSAGLPLEPTLGACLYLIDDHGFSRIFVCFRSIAPRKNGWELIWLLSRRAIDLHSYTDNSNVIVYRLTITPTAPHARVGGQS